MRQASVDVVFQQEQRHLVGGRGQRLHLLEDVELGFVHDFGSGEEWVARRDGGAFLNGRPLEGPGPKERIEILSLEATRTDLVAEHVAGMVGLAREHVREVVVLVPEAFPRTFTCKELVRRASEIGARGDHEPFDEWLARLQQGRTPRMQLGSSPDDDVEDPIGRRPAVYERVADELADLVDRLVELAWPLPGRPAPPDASELAST